MEGPTRGITITVDLLSLIDLFPAAPEFTGPRPAVLVLPGGGYRFHAPHEGLGFSHWLASTGMHAIHLRYPFPSETGWPGPLVAAREALDWITSGEHGLDVDIRHVGVMGASAGGHLAGLLATGTVVPGEPQGPEPIRPDFTILAYSIADLALLPEAPVLTMLGGRADLRDALSPVRHLDDKTGPLFVWTTLQDPPGLTNALAWARAAADTGVSLELHVYPHGWHGLGLADGDAWGGVPEGVPMPPLVRHPHTALWARDCADWLRDVALTTSP